MRGLGENPSPFFALYKPIPLACSWYPTAWDHFSAVPYLAILVLALDGMPRTSSVSE